MFLQGSAFGFGDSVFITGVFYHPMCWITISLHMWLWTKMLDGVKLQPTWSFLGVFLEFCPDQMCLVSWDAIRAFDGLQLSHGTSVLHKPTPVVPSTVGSPSMATESKAVQIRPSMFHQPHVFRVCWKLALRPPSFLSLYNRFPQT